MFMEEPAAATKTEVNTEEDANRLGKPIILGKGKNKKKNNQCTINFIGISILNEQKKK